MEFFLSAADSIESVVNSKIQTSKSAQKKKEYYQGIVEVNKKKAGYFKKRYSFDEAEYYYLIADSLCKMFDLKESRAKMYYAGANNPLWILRKDAEEIEVFKPNKQSIGKYTKDSSFHTHKTTLNEGDTVYLFTDGFVDQFGGENGKKFKTSNFKKLLLTHRHLKMEEQKDLIDKTFEQWRGNLEQVDDVCIFAYQH